jgi:hypothetical protein
MPRSALLLVPLAAAIFGLAGCGGAPAGGPVQRDPSPIATIHGGPPQHIAVVVMENEEYGDIIGSPSAPYINRLAKRYALARSMYAITHPSLPNYLALTGGSTFGIDSDCTDCRVRATSIVDQLSSAGISWKAYMEGLPGVCSKAAAAGGYAKKHDPFLFYTSTAGSRSRCKRVVPLAQLSADERRRTLPKFIWITPDLCHDMHDCAVSTGDRFLSRLIPPLLRALGGRGLLILTWDEGSSDDGCCKLASGGHVAAILAGAIARGGARMRTATDHYSVLQTIEDLLRLRRLRNAACACTPSLQPLLSRGSAPGR